MNPEKLAKLQAQVRIGGKGTARRKKKVVHRSDTTDEKKLQAAMQKVRATQIPGIEEVNMFVEDGAVMHFKNPKVQASLQSNTFAVYGQCDDKQVMDLMPGILNQLGTDSLSHLRKLAGIPEDHGASKDVDDDEVPDLVGNFEEASKDEALDEANLEQTNHSNLAENELDSASNAEDTTFHTCDTTTDAEDTTKTEEHINITEANYDSIESGSNQNVKNEANTSESLCANDSNPNEQISDDKVDIIQDEENEDFGFENQISNLSDSDDTTEVNHELINDVDEKKDEQD